jgi:hypothetical protein
MDPFKILNDDCLLHVVSYVGGNLANPVSGSPQQIVHGVGLHEKAAKTRSAGEAARVLELIANAPSRTRDLAQKLPDVIRFYQSIASVCRRWRAFMDENLSLLATNVYITYHPLRFDCEELNAVGQWACRLKLKIAYIDLIPHEVALDMVRGCDTSGVIYACIPLYVDTDCDSLDESFRQTIGREGQRHFQETLAQECPNLKELDIALFARNYELPPSFLSPALFSLPSVTHLRLGFHKRVHVGNDGTVELQGGPIVLTNPTIAKLVQGFTNLLRLVLDFNSQTSLANAEGNMLYKICSPSLVSLNVANFFFEDRLVVFSLQCPCLADFVCRGEVVHEDENGRQWRMRQRVARASSVPESCGAMLVSEARKWPIVPVRSFFSLD